jgi:hypothetical protein
MIGILHKALGWSLSAIFEEYRCFSTPKERFVDQQWIESWQMELPKEYIRYLQQQHERRKSIDSGESSSSSSSLEDAPALLNDKSKYLLNPEANEPPKPKEKGEKRAIVEAPSTTTHAMLHAASDKMPMLLQRPLSHHQHAMSQPNLLAMTHSNNMTAK